MNKKDLWIQRKIKPLFRPSPYGPWVIPTSYFRQDRNDVLRRKGLISSCANKSYYMCKELILIAKYWREAPARLPK